MQLIGKSHIKEEMSLNFLIPPHKEVKTLAFLLKF